MDMRGNESGQAGGSPATIFVVDDETMLLDLAVMILRPLGFTVRTFSNPKEALAEYPTARPVVLVTDYAMGEMSGLDLLRECRRINPKQKTILLSGTVDEQIYAGEPSKPDRFLAKPYQINDFIESVRTLVKS